MQYYSGIQERVSCSHKELLQLQIDSLTCPFSSSIAAVLEQESKLTELLAAEEAYLKQISRVWWLNEGDQNSKCFHRVIKGRKAKLKITTIQNDEGAVLNDEKTICSEFLKYYTNFLGSASTDYDGGSVDFFHSLNLASLSSDMHSSLLQEVSADEIYRTFHICHIVNPLGQMDILLNFSFLHGR